jgi:hypothetical protein
MKEDARLMMGEGEFQKLIPVSFDFVAIYFLCNFRIRSDSDEGICICIVNTGNACTMRDSPPPLWIGSFKAMNGMVFNHRPSLLRCSMKGVSEYSSIRRRY